MFAFHCQLTEYDYFEYNLYHCYTVPAYREQLTMSKYMILTFLLIFGISEACYRKDVTYNILCGLARALWLVFFKRNIAVGRIRENIKLMRQSGKVPFGKDVPLAFDEGKNNAAVIPGVTK